MAEFYSANLATEVKKGMRQKVEFGGWTHRAPIGYINRKESAEGRRVAYVEPDPNRAPLIRLAFEVYATGDHTIEHIFDEVTSRGLTMRPWRNRPTRPLSCNGLVWILTNKFYAGIVEWNGAEYPGRHQPLVDVETFNRVQELFAARTGREARELATASTVSPAMFRIQQERFRASCAADQHDLSSSPHQARCYEPLACETGCSQPPVT